MYRQLQNVQHTNTIVMKNLIILEKVKKKEKLLEGTADTNLPTKVA